MRRLPLAIHAEQLVEGTQTYSAFTGEACLPLPSLPFEMQSQNGFENSHKKNLHTSKAPLECKKCPQVFMDRYSLRCHIRDEHKPIRFYKCTYKCGFATDDKNAFAQHELRHSKTEPFRCDFGGGCNRAFRTIIALKQHKRLAHSLTLDSNGGRPLVCTKCHQSFKNSINYQRHVESHLRRGGGAADAVAPQRRRKPLDDEEMESLPELESHGTSNSSSISSRAQKSQQKSSQKSSHSHNLRKRSFNFILNLRNFERRRNFGLDDEASESVDEEEEEEEIATKKPSVAVKKRNSGNTSRRKKRAPQKLPMPSAAGAAAAADHSNQLEHSELSGDAVESEQLQLPVAEI